MTEDQTAWTPGSWSIGTSTTQHGTDYVITTDVEPGEPLAWGIDNKADADLFALAPDMAAAIMRYAFCDTPWEGECCHPAGECRHRQGVIDIADRLRTIKGDTNE